jgi:hypothetical protein
MIRCEERGCLLEVGVGEIRGRIGKRNGMTLTRGVEMHKSWDVLIACAYPLIG